MITAHHISPGQIPSKRKPLLKSAAGLDKIAAYLEITAAEIRLSTYLSDGEDLPPRAPRGGIHLAHVELDPHSEGASLWRTLGEVRELVGEIQGCLGTMDREGMWDATVSLRLSQLMGKLRSRMGRVPRYRARMRQHDVS